MSGAETARRRVVQCRIGGAETAAPKWPSPKKGCPPILKFQIQTPPFSLHLFKELTNNIQLNLESKWRFLYEITGGGIEGASLPHPSELATLSMTYDLVDWDPGGST